MWLEFCEDNDINSKEINFAKNDELENDMYIDFHLNYLEDYTLKESSSSFDLADVQNFMYGPFTSRFWLLRKHILHLDKNKFKNESPFYGWDCVTLQIKNKWDVHMIIPN